MRIDISEREFQVAGSRAFEFAGFTGRRDGSNPVQLSLDRFDGKSRGTRLFGWWWLDTVAALALIPFLIKEARAAIRGKCC